MTRALIAVGIAVAAGSALAQEKELTARVLLEAGCELSGTQIVGLGNAVLFFSCTKPSAGATDELRKQFPAIIVCTTGRVVDSPAFPAGLKSCSPIDAPRR